MESLWKAEVATHGEPATPHGADSAVRRGIGGRWRPTANAAGARQAGGHWFEPSTAHNNKACKIAGFVVGSANAVWRVATEWQRSHRIAKSHVHTECRRGLLTTVRDIAFHRGSRDVSSHCCLTKDDRLQRDRVAVCATFVSAHRKALYDRAFCWPFSSCQVAGDRVRRSAASPR
jgi:hypothetical protein